MSGTAKSNTNYFNKSLQLLGSMLYTVFKVTAWIVAAGTASLAILFHVGGAHELIAGTLRVTAATLIVYLGVTMLVRHLFFSSPGDSTQEAKKSETRSARSETAHAGQPQRPAVAATQRRGTRIDASPRRQAVPAYAHNQVIERKAIRLLHEAR